MKKKVFISWSGEFSKEIAQAIYQWLPNVIQAIDPYISVEGLRPGQVWDAALLNDLRSTDFGILCVSNDNQGAKWLNFEAGLFAAIEGRPVVPILVDLSPGRVSGPIGHFHAKKMAEKEFFDVICDINGICEDPLTKDRLEYAFKLQWPNLDESIGKIKRNYLDTTDQKPTQQLPIESSTESMVEEILLILRSQQRQQSTVSGQTAEELSDIAEDLHKLEYLQSSMRRLIFKELSEFNERINSYDPDLQLMLDSFRGEFSALKNLLTLQLSKITDATDNLKQKYRFRLTSRSFSSTSSSDFQHLSSSTFAAGNEPPTTVEPSQFSKE